MPVEVFNYGQFPRYQNVVEWDGANHADILDYIRQIDTPDALEADWWVIESVTDTELQLLRPNTHPAAWGETTLVVTPVNWWLGVANDGYATFVQTIDPRGKWKTSDLYGRPTDVSEMMAPLPEDPPEV